MRAFVCGCKGLALDDAERRFLSDTQPFGVILFKRNVDCPDQLRGLIDQINSAAGRPIEVLIDQEGGRVQRLGPPHWPAYPAAARFAAAGLPPQETERLVRLAARLIGRDLRSLGISIDCLPVLDVPIEGSHNVIGDRAYGHDAETVARLGRAAALGLLDEGILPTIKHLPGHGRATVDSHLALPVVEAPLALLAETDFVPFRANADLPAGMSAHVVYRAIDPTAPGTTSQRVIGEIIRKSIGFTGLLFSDDLSMQALHGSLGERATAAFAAGIDIALHCNGDLDEANAVAAAAPPVEAETLARVHRASACRAKAQAEASDFDPVDAWAQIAAALAIAA